MPKPKQCKTEHNENPIPFRSGFEFVDGAMRQASFGTIEELRRAVEAWATISNEKLNGIQWLFSVEKARAKLKSLYPIIE